MSKLTQMLDRPYYRELRAKGYGVRAAVMAVRRHDHFRKELSARVKLDKKRTRSAKKGWKTRRANQKGI